MIKKIQQTGPAMRNLRENDEMDTNFASPTVNKACVYKNLEKGRWSTTTWIRRLDRPETMLLARGLERSRFGPDA